MKETFPPRQAKWPDCDPGIAADAIANDAPADRCILALFTPRSGSSWLAKIAGATEQLGFFEEYINPDFIYEVATQMYANDRSTLFAMLKRWAKSENGVFSMEARAVDIELFGEAEVFEAFGTASVIFFLWRDNIVAQGVSLYRAVATRRFHSTDAPAAAPEYDPEQIAEWMAHIVEIENQNLTFLDRHGLHARFLRYEDMIRDRKTTLTIVADAVRINLLDKHHAASREHEPCKLADDWNQSAECRFREERRDFVWDLEAQRLIRRAPTSHEAVSPRIANSAEETHVCEP
jgi:LPS sulfotransferase NodH